MNQSNLSKNKRIWTDVQFTPKDKTTKLTFGTKLTAINGSWLFEQATEVFGPCGQGWGWMNMETHHQHLPHPIEEGKPVIVEQAFHVALELFWRDGDNVYTIPAIAACPEWTWNDKWGKMILDDDAGKKAQTDAIKKALYALGFAADVLSNTFTGDKYVSRQEQHDLTQAWEQSTLRGTSKQMLKRFSDLQKQNGDGTSHATKNQLNFATRSLRTLVPDDGQRLNLWGQLFGSGTKPQQLSVAQAGTLITWIGSTSESNWQPNETAIQHVKDLLK